MLTDSSDSDSGGCGGGVGAPVAPRARAPDVAPSSQMVGQGPTCAPKATRATQSERDNDLYTLPVAPSSDEDSSDAELLEFYDSFASKSNSASQQVHGGTKSRAPLTHFFDPDASQHHGGALKLMMDGLR